MADLGNHAAPDVEQRPADAAGLRDANFTRYVLPEVETLLRVAMTLTAQPADAEDLVQDTLIRAYQAAHRFDGRHPRSWLLTIMRHAEANRPRRRRPHLLDEPDTETEPLAAGLAPSARTTPENIVVGEKFDEVLDAALAALPLKHRQVMVLVDVNGLSYAEAAKLLRAPAGTVMSRLHWRWPSPTPGRSSHNHEFFVISLLAGRRTTRYERPQTRLDSISRPPITAVI
jgi:RNA polymerase sigma-70 factor (ECF subfamily)